MSCFKKITLLALALVAFVSASTAYADGTPFTAVSAGWHHTLALRSDGTAWSWGGNGSSAPLSDYAAKQVPGLSNITAISAGFRHSIALKDGSVWYWSESQPTPVQVSGLSNIYAIAAGATHDIALKAGGTVWYWSKSEPTPTQVTALSRIIAIAAGADHSLALKNDGTVWAWGRNSRGQLGNGSNQYNNSVQPVAGLSNITAISAGAWHNFAIRNDGTVWAWGWNQDGQFGNGSTLDTNTPVQVTGLPTNIKTIAAGRDHTIVMMTNGTLQACGWNYYGQLGNGTMTDSPTPIPVPDLSNVKSVSAGELHTVILKEDGTVWGWGYDRYGQLGLGSHFHSPVQLPLTFPTDTTPPSTPVVECGEGAKTSVPGEISIPFNISWSASDPESGIIDYQYRIHKAQPGYEYYTDWVSSGSLTKIARLTYLAPGSTIRCYVKARNAAGLWSDEGSSNTITVVSSALGKLILDGWGVYEKGAIVTAVFSDCYYIESPDKSSGIRVIGAGTPPAVGTIVDISGVMRTNTDSERYIEPSSVIEQGTGSIKPLFTLSRALGGADIYFSTYVGTGQFGVTGGTGLNNIGLLVRTSGKVTAIGDGYLYIDDGSGLTDGTGNQGVKVICDPIGYKVDDQLFVTGISSCFKTSTGNLARQILTRDASDALKY